MTRLTVAVIGGGRNSEHTVSLASAAAVVDALDSSRYRVIALTIDRHGEWMDASGEPVGLRRAVEILRECDIVFPMVHGRHGEDGTLAALCESIRVPFVGSGVSAGAIGMNKHVTKLVAESIGIRTARGVLLDRASSARHRYRHPVVVKPNTAGSSAGVTMVSDSRALPEALDRAFAEDAHILVEEAIIGREIDIAVLRRTDGTLLLSPPLEIETEGVFDEQAKYGGAAVFHIPARLDDTSRRALEIAAARLYEELECSGVARVDFFLTDGGFVLNEINTTPGFTAQSQVPRMFASVGIPYETLLDLLITEALASRGGRVLHDDRAIM